MKHKKTYPPHAYHIHKERKQKKLVFVCIISIVGVVLLLGGYCVLKSIKQKEEVSVSSSLPIQGRIERIALPFLYVVTEHPSSYNSQIPEEKRYRITVPSKQTLSLTTVFLDETGPIEEKTEIHSFDIPPNAALKGEIRITGTATDGTTTALLLSGEITSTKAR